MEQISYFAIIIGAIFVNNVVLAQFLGICPFLGVSSKVDTSMGMGAAVTFVMALTALVAWSIQTYILEPLHIEYMQTIVFILVIAALVQMVEIMLKKLSPSLYQALGIFLPLITTNCAVLGVAILMIQKEFTLLQSVVYSVATAAGFALALVLFAGIRERLELEDVPAALRGTPIALVTAGILAMAFMGFSGWVLTHTGLKGRGCAARSPFRFYCERLFDDVDLLALALHVEVLAGILLEEVVLPELLDERAVARDLLFVERLLAFEHPNLAADLERMDQVAPCGESRQDDDQQRRADPEFADETLFHRRQGMCMNLCVWIEMFHCGRAFA